MVSSDTCAQLIGALSPQLRAVLVTGPNSFIKWDVVNLTVVAIR
jgi:hypothetical protein